jgi:hypothetical protein
VLLLLLQGMCHWLGSALVLHVLLDRYIEAAAAVQAVKAPGSPLPCIAMHASMPQPVHAAASASVVITCQMLLLPLQL